MFKNIPRKIIVAFILLLAVFGIGTLGYVVIEKWDFFDSFYMTVITLTTVGYGEVRPLTTDGRIFTIFLLLSGFGILTYGVTTGISFMLEGELGHIIRRHKMEKLIQSFKNHYIICANGEIGEYVAEEFIKTNQAVVVITTDKMLEEKFLKHNIPMVVDNPAEDETLEKAGIRNAKGLIAVLGDDKYNLFVVLSARGLNPDIRIIAQSIEKSSVIKINKAGADDVILTDAIGGMRMASAMLRPTVVSFLDTMLRGNNEHLRIEEAEILAQSEVVNKTIAESNINKKTGLIVIAVKEGTSGSYIYNPGPGQKLNKGDVLIVIGNTGQLEKLYAIAGR
ncbi:MAG: potassium channel protein [Elusimicrobia bacterium]|nr:potassium channel protein [Candidatus Liberimonas magnetica]